MLTKTTRQVSVCYYEEDNDWWVSKRIKKHTSTVLSVSWSPDSSMLMTGCADGVPRLFGAAVKDQDSK